MVFDVLVLVVCEKEGSTYKLKKRVPLHSVTLVAIGAVSVLVRYVLYYIEITPLVCMWNLQFVGSIQ